ncbi:type IV pilus twitching motility protein PilT (plasmid) [Clostridium perfringens]
MEISSNENMSKLTNVIRVLIEVGIKEGVSDIHIGEGSNPIARLNGNLIKLSQKTIITRGDIESIVKEYCPELLNKLNTENYLDTSFQYDKTRFRANFYFERKKLACALRLIPGEIPNIDNLNLPNPVKNILGLKNGLVLVTGATGSGKSTTIASLINEINKTKSEHILTIEDPIEFVYEDKKSLIHQREIGSDCHSFHDAILCALREDPDIIVLGEIRTHESISSALTLAETGHLVFATLHTKSAAESVDRIVDVFPPEQQNQIRVQLANTLKYVIAQRLVPKANSKGRTPLIELMVVNQGIRSSIAGASPTSSIVDQISLNNQRLGSQTFAQGARDLLAKGFISKEVADEFILDNH